MSKSNLKEEALIEYLDECTEMVERFSQSLVKIEAGESGPDTIAAVYRDMHTIKGSSHLFGFAGLGQLAHAMESCLDPVRKGQAAITPALIDVLYSCIDVINAMLAGIRAQKTEPDMTAQLKGLLPRLVEIAEHSVAASLFASAEKVVPKEALGTSEPVKASTPVSAPATDRTQTPAAPSASVKPPGPAPAKAPVSSAVISSLVESGFGFFDDDAPAAPAKAPAAVASVANAASVSFATAGAAVSTAAESAGTKTPPPARESRPGSEDPVKSETIRVHVSLLDSLMNLIGELVLIRNQLLQYARQNDENAEFVKVSQRLDVLTAELQNEVMKTRMQPIGNILNKFTRVVRDLARDLSKKIDLEIEGADTELDKTIIEAVQDPLTHIVRNSVDHGVEPVEERRKAGKPDTGRIRISARHESGQVIIEVTDDGQGLDRQKIGAKAVEKGIVTADELARMSDRDVHLLIMAPGFSTAQSVSNISGRGVGMDVVRTNIEKIGGVVELSGSPKTGTTVRMRIPLTLAIVPALIVRSLGQKFAIPQAKLTELLRIDTSEADGEKIESLQGRPVLRLRGKLLPLVYLCEVLGGRPPSVAEQSDVVNIVVLNADGLPFGLIVEHIDDSADIVVKALSQFLKDLTLFSGATIMGDGAVALTLDVGGIATVASLRENREDTPLMSVESAKKKHTHELDTAEYLLVDVNGPGLYAIPLVIVNRLEEFEATRVELSGEQRVIRYRDTLLPLISLTEFLHLEPSAEQRQKEKIATVVVRRGEALYGIEVEGIRDVVSMTSKVDKKVRDRPGILGTIIAKDRVIVVADVLGVIDSVRSALAVDAGVTSAEEKSDQTRISSEQRHSCRILIAEDSSFFRNYIRQVLEEAGFRVESAFDGGEALRMLDLHPGNYYSLLLSDIEMPNVDGLGLARRVRETSKIAHLPMVAITTRFNNADIERGMQAGFDKYLEKLNAEKLILELDSLLFQRGERKEMKRANAG